MDKQHHQEEEQWSEVISGKAGLLDLKLKDIWRYKDLLWLFVKRDFSAQYKQTILGPVWHFIQPIFTTVMFLLIFKKIANIPSDGIPSTLFFMSGITIWNYFAACLNSTSSTFVSNANIFGKVYFPRLVLPISIVFSNIIRFGIQFLLLLSAMVIWHVNQKEGYQIHIGFSWLLIPIITFIMAGIGLGLGIIISSLTTKYRDFTVLISFAVQLLMYLTPVVYPLSFAREKASQYLFLIRWNPLTPLVEGFKYALFQKPADFHFTSLGYSALFMLVVLFIGALLFNKVEKSFMDTV
jgi:lipopolysaccharide transport system permease protein